MLTVAAMSEIPASRTLNLRTLPPPDSRRFRHANPAPPAPASAKAWLLRRLRLSADT